MLFVKLISIYIYIYRYFLTTDSILCKFLQHSEHSELCQLLRVIMFIKVELRWMASRRVGCRHVDHQNRNPCIPTMSWMKCHDVQPSQTKITPQKKTCCKALCESLVKRVYLWCGVSSGCCLLPGGTSQLVLKLFKTREQPVPYRFAASSHLTFLDRGLIIRLWQWPFIIPSKSSNICIFLDSITLGQGKNTLVV